MNQPVVTPYQVGKFYNVLVVEISGEYSFHGLSHVPVIGPQHNDKAILNFDYDHYHVDWRFVDKRTWASITEHGENGNVFGQVLHTINGVGAITMRRRLCKREFGQYPVDAPSWLPKLEETYISHSLGPKRICPHKGADLSSIAPNADGLVTCPLHGLRWCTDSGKLSPQRFTEPTTPVL